MCPQVGTDEYSPPEEGRDQGRSFKSDYWALGILLHEILTCRTPFEGRTPSSITQAIGRYANGGRVACEALQRAVLNDPAARAHPVSEEAARFMGALLTGSEDERPDFKELAGHAWLKDLDLQRMLRREAEAPWLPQPVDTTKSAGSASPKRGAHRPFDAAKWDPIFAEGFGPVRRSAWETA